MERNWNEFVEWIKKGVEIKAFDIASEIHHEFDKDFDEYYENGIKRGYINEKDCKLAHALSIREGLHCAENLFMIPHLLVSYECADKAHETEDAISKDDVKELKHLLQDLINAL